MAFVVHRFKLEERHEELIRSMTPKFGYNGFGELVFYRTYSRICCDICRGGLLFDKAANKDYCPLCGPDFAYGQEHWPDVVIRVTNGTFSIRKDWFLKNHIHWDEAYWQQYAARFAASMFKMEWLPPGRGMWAMGSDFVYNRGSMALYNCAYTDITTHEMDEDISWLMDSLMHGVGVGYGPIRDDKMELHTPRGKFDFIIPDTREGWCDATRYMLRAYLYGEAMPNLIYDEIRGPGLPIRGFGGVSSGPDPLKDLHRRITHECEIYKSRKEYDSLYFKANIPNHVGVCVVAGNVRRSAELMKGRVTDPIFMDLKDYRKFPEREGFGWMSNNSVELIEDEDFMRLGEIAQRILRNGEPGYINRQNMPFGRIGKKMRGLRKDKAVGFNPLTIAA
jgi:ribonucleoside-triphosphate reductase (thioredoxin)